MRVLFVHGSCVVDGAWWWHRMTQPLAELGLETEAVELPSCGLAEGPAPTGDLLADIAAVREAARGAGPVLLVGSSYGGMVITGAAEGLGNVRRLVYVSSMLPKAGEPLPALVPADAPQWLEPDGSGCLRPGPALADGGFPRHFLSDCDEAVVPGALARVGRQSANAFTQAPGYAGWADVPSTSVICTADRATAPDTQRRWAARAGRTVELDCGHHPFLSRPRELAEIIAADAD